GRLQEAHVVIEEVLEVAERREGHCTSLDLGCFRDEIGLALDVLIDLNEWRCRQDVSARILRDSLALGTYRPIPQGVSAHATEIDVWNDAVRLLREVGAQLGHEDLCEELGLSLVSLMSNGPQ